MKLNIGAGKSEISGFTPIDRANGQEACPLSYESNSVDEIRASHILEHFGHRDVPKVLDEWVRVLKPGGRIRIAVPDMRKIADMASDNSDPRWPLYAMGGQTDDNDYHRSLFTRERLEELMMNAGIEGIQPWQSKNTDCASLPVSLNLEGRKSPQGKPDPGSLVKVAAIMSVPRVGWNDAYSAIVEALTPLRIPITQFNGVFWGQCMQRAFEDAIEHGVEWLLTVDYDSMFTSRDVDKLIGALGNTPDMDAVVALQCRRGDDESALMTLKGKTSVQTDGTPFRVDTAHFGLTLIRMSAMADIPKPWFASRPTEEGTWGEGRLDDDIWFWHQWKEAGKTVYIHPECRIGHLQVMVSLFDDDMQPHHMHVKQWREKSKSDAR